MARFDLFLTSGLILFLELACIRWLPAHVLFLSFFTNTVLLACFVGMSVGCMIARKPGSAIRSTPYWLLGTVAAGVLVELLRRHLEAYTDVGNQARPEVVFFGAEASALKQLSFRVPVELVAGSFFFLCAAMFVGLGQELGRGFNRIPVRTTAYGLNLAGSLVGIVLFALGSWLELSPVVWFGLSAIGIFYLISRTEKTPSDSARFRFGPLAALILAVGVTLPSSGLIHWKANGKTTSWSRYYRVDYEPGKRYIATNLIGHQVMHPRESLTSALYDQPYLFQQAVGREKFERILIIGSGSGNDLARALYWASSDAKIDAVEIDAAIYRIGEADHPDQPYQDPRVTVHLNDGRNFLRSAPAGEYDLVIFALVDSLVLHSGYSNIRLESYLFTQEAFEDVARVLKPDGITAVYNFFRHGWIVSRIQAELQNAFGEEPIVLVLNPDDEGEEKPLNPDDLILPAGGFAGLFAGRQSGIEPIRRAFAENGNTYWLPAKASIHAQNSGAFGPVPPTVEQAEPEEGRTKNRLGSDTELNAKTDWVPLRPVRFAEATTPLPVATDDWPFLYVRKPSLPWLTVRGMVLTALLAGLLWFVFRDRSPAVGPVAAKPGDTGLLIRAFLLGAGFMLIETKAVVEMALLHGSTWEVNTVVFGAILLMALAGNLFAAVVRPKRLEIFYIGLFAALAANVLIPMDSFLGLEPWLRTAASAALVFAPVAFAGVVFPVSFARAPRPDRFFGWNVAGSLAGGLAENLSMLLGFQTLLLVGLGVYLASTLFGSREIGKASPISGV